ncbi:MAG: hypothetical protein ACU826_12465, partial [Gammaproteobacteria bacterium]
MDKEIRVLVLGTGQMGSAISRLLLRKKGIRLAGAFARRSRREGLDVGRAIGLGRDLGLAVGCDLNRSIDRIRPDVAIQATCSKLAEAREEIETLLAAGVNVVSIAEEMAYPGVKNPELAEKFRQMAVENGVSLLGTGINPGFVLDLLPVLLTAVCAEVRSIRAMRVNDLSSYGPTVLNAQGVGLTPAEFERGLASGAVEGHFGFEESIAMIAASLGWVIDRVEQTREPIISSVRRETPHAVVEKGRVAGCLHTATAYAGRETVIRLIHPQQIHPGLEGIETGDTI